jgi:hypothetical protein
MSEEPSELGPDGQTYSKFNNVANSILNMLMEKKNSNSK